MKAASSIIMSHLTEYARNRPKKEPCSNAYRVTPESDNSTADVGMSAVEAIVADIILR